MPNETPEAKKAIELINGLNNGKLLHDQFAVRFREQYKIAGKTIPEWKEYFYVEIPPDPTAAVIHDLDAQLIQLHQEASFYKAEADARYVACQNASSDRYRESFTQLVVEYKAKGEKLPAKDTLATLAENYIVDIKQAITHAEIEQTFWKQILLDLYNSRKLIENVTISLATEAKALQNERLLDRLNASTEFDKLYEK